jgi:hypothetical protein
MFNKIKNVMSGTKAKVVGIGTVVGSMALTVCAYADGTADTSITTAFQHLSDNAEATIGAVAAIAVAIAGVFLAWKYARKIFNHVAK